MLWTPLLRTIVKMAQDPASGIKLTDTKRVNYLACAQGKQTKNRQPRMDSGLNSPIDMIRGLVCSDLKGPLTPRDRLENRYLVNFIDHRSYYCRVFQAKTKDAAAMHFKHFLVAFERQLKYRTRSTYRRWRRVQASGYALQGNQCISSSERAR